MQRNTLKMGFLLASLGFGMFLGLGQGQVQAASTRADVTAEESAQNAGPVCTPGYCSNYPLVCRLAGCPGY